MKNSGDSRMPRTSIIICVALFVCATVPFISNARSTSTTVVIANNSGRDIRNVYLSHVNADDWGGNQLGGSTIASGQSFTLSDVACDGDQMKIIAEDQDGCFLYSVITCGQSSTWTITNDTPRDCGY